MAKRTTRTSFKIFDRTDIERLMDNYRAKVAQIVEAAEDAYWEAAKFVVDEAVMRAPVDTHLMEKSIYASELRGRGSYRVALEVDGSLKYEKTGKTVAEVFKYIHDAMIPEGSELGLGPKSRRKQAAVPVVVGGGFLRRAIDENEGEIRQIIQRIVARKISSAGIAKKKYRMKRRGNRVYRVGVKDDF